MERAQVLVLMVRGVNLIAASSSSSSLSHFLSLSTALSLSFSLSTSLPPRVVILPHPGAESRDASQLWSYMFQSGGGRQQRDIEELRGRERLMFAGN